MCRLSEPHLNGIPRLDVCRSPARCQTSSGVQTGRTPSCQPHDVSRYFSLLTFLEQPTRSRARSGSVVLLGCCSKIDQINASHICIIRQVGTSPHSHISYMIHYSSTPYAQQSCSSTNSPRSLQAPYPTSVWSSPLPRFMPDRA
jgi:hypothetical protein